MVTISKFRVAIFNVIAITTLIAGYYGFQDFRLDDNIYALVVAAVNLLMGARGDGE